MSDYTITPTEIDGFGFYSVKARVGMGDGSVEVLTETVQDAHIVATALSNYREYLIGLTDIGLGYDETPQHEKSVKRINCLSRELGFDSGVEPYPAPREAA